LNMERKCMMYTISFIHTPTHEASPVWHTTHEEPEVQTKSVTYSKNSNQVKWSSLRNILPPQPMWPPPVWPPSTPQSPPHRELG
jgi:hypothetical protein